MPNFANVIFKVNASWQNGENERWGIKESHVREKFSSPCYGRRRRI